MPNGLNTFQRVLRLAKSDSIRRPAWYKAAELIPPQRKPYRVPKPKRLIFEEERLVLAFYQKVGSGGEESKFMHLPGAESESPAVAFVRRQMQLMQKSKLSEREAFNSVKEEAMNSGQLYDAAVNLAVTTAAERQKLLDEINYEPEPVYGANHTQEVAEHVTEAFVLDTMRMEGLSREAAEARAVRQRIEDRRRSFEMLQKQGSHDTTYARSRRKTDYSSMPNKSREGYNQRKNSPGAPHFSSPLRVAGAGKGPAKEDKSKPAAPAGDAPSTPNAGS